ncbi:MAG: hypothetical protein QXE80_03270 [Pyrobaculum sp.]
MAYRAPGVYVKDIYTEPERQPSSSEFFPAVVAPVRNVIENFELEGVLYDSSGPVTVKLADQKKLPITIFDEIVESSFKVYLIPQSGARDGYFWNSITRKHNAKFGVVTQSTLKPYIDITADVEKTNLVSDKEFRIPATLTNAVLVNGASFFDPTTRKVTQPCSVVVEFETRKLKTKVIRVNISEYSRTNGTGKVTLTFNLPSMYIPDTPNNNYILKVWETEQAVDTVIIPNANIDTLTREVFVDVQTTTPETYTIHKLELEYPIVNPIFSTAVTITTNQKIREFFGTIHPLNTVAYATHQALNSGAEAVIAFALPYDNWPNVAEVLDKALGVIEQNPSVYSIYIGLDSANSSFLNKINTWLDKYNSAAEASVAPKIVMTGYEDYTSLGSVTNSSIAAQTLVSRIAGLEQKRLRVVVNPTAVVDYEAALDGSGKIEVVVPGHLYGAEFVGQVYKLMNMKGGIPSDSFTLKGVRIFKRLRYPNGYPNWFTAQELNMLAEAGYWILYQKTENDPIIVRHGLTTAERKKATSEDAVVRTVDYVMLTLRNQLERLVGNVKLNQSNIATVFYPRINDLLRDMVNKGIIEQGSAIKTITIDPADKDKLLITLSLVVAFPANVIELTVEV